MLDRRRTRERHELKEQGGPRPLPNARASDGDDDERALWTKRASRTHVLAGGRARLEWWVGRRKKFEPAI